MEEILEKIRSRGYWRVNIRPTTFKKDRISNLSELRALMKRSSVSLRGWPYPYVNEDKVKNGDDWIECECDSYDIIEYWRFFQSGQFIHYFSISEDYVDEAAKKAQAWGWKPAEKVSGYLAIFSTLYRVTEIYEFAARLTQHKVLSPGIYILVKLCNINKHQLFFWDSSRFLRDSLIANIEEINLESTMRDEELLANGRGVAIEKTLNIMERFNWNNPPKEIFIEEQKKFLERRL
jgi:hypothetical protein